MKVDTFIESKLRTASFSATEDQVRQIKASLKAADIVGTVVEADMNLANKILDRALDSMFKVVSNAVCPRCSSKMVGAKLATRRAANYCTNCRVVTPQA